MRRACHSVATDHPRVYLGLLLLVFSVMLLACGEGQLSSSQGLQAAGEATVTAWAKEGTIFPELAAMAEATSPTTVPQPPASQMTATDAPSPTAPTASMPDLSQAAAEATPSVRPSAPRPAAPGVGPSAKPAHSLEPVGRIAIPKLGTDASVVEVSWHIDQIDGYAVAVWDTVSEAAGHHRGTEPPGGEGNCVISGHSRSQDGGVFNELWLLEPGDLIRLTNVRGDSYQYVVERVERVQELGQRLEQRLANASLMAPTQDARLTLITCWPDWAYTHRVIVVARLQ